MDRLDDTQGQPVRVLKADGFRGQLPQDEEDVGYSKDDDGDGEGFRRILDEGDGDSLQQRLERPDRRGAADGRGERTHDGHPDLYRCKKAVGVLLNRFDELGLLISRRGEACDTALAGGNNRQFGAGKKTIDQDQYRYDDKVIENPFHTYTPPYRRSPGGSFLLRTLCSLHQ